MGAKYRVTDENIDAYRDLMRHSEIAETKVEYITNDGDEMRIYVKKQLVYVKSVDTTDWYLYTDHFKTEKAQQIWEYVKAKGKKEEIKNGTEYYEIEVKELLEEVKKGIEEFVVWMLVKNPKHSIRKAESEYASWIASNGKNRPAIESVDGIDEEYGTVLIELVKIIQKSNGVIKELIKRLIEEIIKAQTKDKRDIIYTILLTLEMELKELNMYKPITKVNTRKIIKEIEKEWG